MAGNFLPANPELQAQLNKAIDPGLFSRIFDSALGLQLQQQEAGQSLFKSIAASNPQLAQFLIAQPGVAESLTKPPTPFPKPGTITPGQALSKAASVYQPEMQPAKSADVRGATEIMMKLAQAGKAAFGQDVIDAKGIKRGTAMLAAGVPLDPSIVGGDAAKFSALVGADNTQEGLQHQLLDARVKEIEASGRPVSAEERLRIYREEVLGRTPVEMQNDLLQARLNQIEMGIQNLDLRNQLTDALSNLGRPMTIQEKGAAEQEAGRLKTEGFVLGDFKTNLDKVAAGDASARIALMTSLAGIQDKDLYGILQAISTQAAPGQPISPAVSKLIDFFIKDRKKRFTDLTNSLSAETARQPAPIPGKSTGVTAPAPNRVDRIMELLGPALQEIGVKPTTSEETP